MENALDSFPREDSAVLRRDIIRWWEERRTRYNVMVGLVGFVTWWLVLIAGSAAVKPGVDFEEPLAMIMGPVIYCIMANLCYTLGWIFDTVFYRGSPRKALFKAGLIFSLVLTALPGIWAVAAWLMTVITGKKLD
jgi:hypothetical protein